MNKASFVHGLGQREAQLRMPVRREDKSNGGIDCVDVAVEARRGQMDDDGGCPRMRSRSVADETTNRGATRIEVRGDDEWNA